MVFTIEIVQHQHFIEGDEYFAYLEDRQAGECITLQCCVKQDSYLKMCENLDGLKFRLEQMGNKVIVETKFVKDPNFDSYAEAMECLENMEKDRP